MKSKGESGGPFTVNVGKGREERSWFCVRVNVEKVTGRGGNGGFKVIE